MGLFTLLNPIYPHLAVSASNLITKAGQTALSNSLNFDRGPSILYLGVGLGTTSPAFTQTALDEEIYRETIFSRHETGGGTIRFATTYGPAYANGDLREVGLFDAAHQRGGFNYCEGTAGFTSDGTLALETTQVRQGTASLQTQMGTAGSLAFTFSGPITSNKPTFGGTVNTYLQFWYGVNLGSASYDVGTATIRIGANSTNYYQWSWVPDTSPGTWVHFSQALTTASVVGTPGTALSTFTYFQLSHPPFSPAHAEYLDAIEFFQLSGNLLARGTLSYTKVWGSVAVASYHLLTTTE